MIKRIKYRKQVGNFMSGKRQMIAKGEIFKQEHAHADLLEDNQKNDNFGFKCLHYSVSEASGNIQIMILNKTGKAGQVRAKTIDAEAKAGDDFEEFDQVVSFAAGEKSKLIKIIINDDDNWEPDEDFFVQLYQPGTLDALEGADTRTRVTIIDDDKPGQIAFEENETIKASAAEGVAEIVIVRKNGSDGVVKVEYETVELDQSEHTATANVDFVPQKGTLVFNQGEIEQTISVQILPREDQDMRDESFGIRLFNVTPQGAKLSKKSFQIVNICTDIELKKKADAYN